MKRIGDKRRLQNTRLIILIILLRFGLANAINQMLKIRVVYVGIFNL